jgi:cobalamin biosynthesis protein CbiG
MLDFPSMREQHFSKMLDRLQSVNCGGAGILAVSQVPKDLWMGLGCQSGVTVMAIEQAIAQALADQNWSLAQVLGIATIQSKCQEPGILAVCAKYGWLLKLYDAATLQQVKVLQSTVVQQAVGTGSVAEAAAWLAAGQASSRQVYQIAGQYLTVAIGLQTF